MMKNKIVELLDSLKFKGMSLALDHQIAQAEKKGMSIQEVIYNLLFEEMRFRQERSVSIVCILPNSHGNGRSTHSPSIVNPR